MIHLEGDGREEGGEEGVVLSYRQFQAYSVRSRSSVMHVFNFQNAMTGDVREILQQVDTPALRPPDTANTGAVRHRQEKCIAHVDRGETRTSAKQVER